MKVLLKLSAVASGLSCLLYFLLSVKSQEHCVKGGGDQCEETDEKLYASSQKAMHADYEAVKRCLWQFQCTCSISYDAILLKLQLQMISSLTLFSFIHSLSRIVSSSMLETKVRVLHC